MSRIEEGGGGLPRRRVTRSRLGGAALALLMLSATLLTAAPASATTGSGPDGQQVTVTPATGIDPGGQQVTVTGSGFDTSKGIYVALCIDNGPGEQPSPCLGGVDMEGAGGASAWISSNPPAYGEGLAEPFTESGGRGSFEVTLSVSASDPFTDCLDPEAAPRGCVIGSRADHTRSADRSADVRIPVSFGSEGAAEAGSSGDDETAAATEAADAASSDEGSLASTGVTVGVAALVAVLLIGLGVTVVVRRRKPSTDATGV